MKVLGLRKAYETIRLDESPDSPEYVIDLSDAALGEKARVLGVAVADADRILEEGDRADVSELYRSVIVTMLGEAAYGEIVEYVGGGMLEAEEVCLALTPLVLYLVELFNATVEANMGAAAARYLGKGADGAAVL